MNKKYILKYNRPSEKTYKGWEEEALPLGNGYIGAKIFGLINEEIIQFNEKSLWSGGPNGIDDYKGGNDDYRFESLRNVQKLLKAGKINKARELAESKLIGPQNSQYGKYLSFGEIDIKYNDSGKISNFERELDISNSLHYTKYLSEGKNIERESFISYPDNVFVMYLKNEKKQTITINLNLTNYLVDSDENSKMKVGDSKFFEKGILLSGYVCDNNLQFSAYLEIETDGGIENDHGLKISNFNDVKIYLSAKTNYIQNPKLNYKDDKINLNEEVKNIVKTAILKGYQKIKEDHIKDYKNLFDRVKLNISEYDDRYMDEILEEYKIKQNNYLEELYFQYGRYLLICSSRAGKNALPANLQGIWNAVDNPPWNSDYHLNINLQMNYWPAYITNLSETAIPLINYVDDLRFYGRKCAEKYAGIISNDDEENGWMVHTQVTIFGWTAPGWNYYWGWAPTSNAWIMQNVYDYFKYTLDYEILRNKIYPILKETVKFWNSFLIYDEKSDRYVVSPSYSPEHGDISIGNTYDQSLVYDLFSNYLESAKIMNDIDYIEDVKIKMSKLRPIHINSKGMIKEWYEEDSSDFNVSKIEKNHRHISHLVGLFPGKLFDYDEKYKNAAKMSLEDRGDGGTGWSKAYKMNLWAKLGDGGRAHKLLRELLVNSTLKNLWDTHPPFQIDGNFGAVSGIANMLVSYKKGQIIPLPALPKSWKDGEVIGLKVFNKEVNIKWENGKVIDFKVI